MLGISFWFPVSSYKKDIILDEVIADLSTKYKVRGTKQKAVLGKIYNKII